MVSARLASSAGPERTRRVIRTGCPTGGSKHKTEETGRTERGSAGGAERRKWPNGTFGPGTQWRGEERRVPFGRSDEQMVGARFASSAARSGCEGWLAAGCPSGARGTIFNAEGAED